MARQTFRIAIRRFDPFASAIHKQWAAFQTATGTDLALEAEQLDLHPLYESYFGQDDLRRGNWDVAFLSSDWFSAVRERGMVLNLDPLLADDPPDGYPDGWTDTLLRLQRFPDTTLGVPYHDGPECLMYRKDLFENPAEQAAFARQYGRPLQVPRTWAEFHEVARFFHRPGQGLYGTAFAAYPDGHNTVYDFCLQLWTRGGELFDRAGRLQLDTPEAIAALEFYREIVNDSSAMHPNVREMDSVKLGLAFAAGEAAMTINWFGFAAMAETVAESRVKGRVDISMVPAGPGGRSVSLSAYWILAIAAGSPHPDVAYQFLRHCLTAPMDKLLTLEGGIGCRKSTWADPDVNQIIPFYHKVEPLHDNCRELPRLSNWADLAGHIDALVLDVINTNRPVEQLAREHQARLGGEARK